MCLCVAVNSHACYIWIVNDITDCNTCLFSVLVFFCFRKGSVCVSCVCVCLAVNSPVCYIWIVNDVTDSNCRGLGWGVEGSMLAAWMKSHKSEVART